MIADKVTAVNPQCTLRTRASAGNVHHTTSQPCLVVDKHTPIDFDIYTRHIDCSFLIVCHVILECRIDYGQCFLL